eukprot:XP_001693770.1 predicted protein [Chlamydomonas reinhardtii]
MHERDRYNRGRSPPPSGKRMRRDGPYDGRDYDAPYNGRGSPDYDRRPPSPRHDDREMFERRASVGRDRPEEEKRPMTFKEFMLHKVPDDAAPDVAHRMFQEYLVEYYGSAIKAEFEQNKDSDMFKYQFDPRNFAKVVASRAEEAQDSAKHVAADLASGTLDPAHEAFAQGMYDLAPKIEKPADKPAAAPKEGEKAAPPPAEDAGPKFAPNTCWSAERESVGKLDLQLHWLWKVHGVDYYAGIELNEQDWPYRLNCCRLIRGPKPEEGEGEDEATAKADREKLGRQVDETWNRRISLGDPIEAKCMKARIEDELDKWIESQVTMVADNKWGSKLSNKLFVGKKYVIKHIKTKHQDKLAVERERILDQLYFDNFRQWKEDEERRRVEEEQHAGEGAPEGEGAVLDPRGMREYFDLDHPANNRAVLDYGDL